MPKNGLERDNTIINIHHLLHKSLLKIVKHRDLPELQYQNSSHNVSGNAIYVANHSCMYDVPIAALTIEKHFYIMAGRQRLKLTDWLFFELNGVIWVDRKDKKERALAKQNMNGKLRQGENVLVFPEGTWNYMPSVPILPLYWGVIASARECGVPIIPLAMDYRNNTCRLKFGKPMLISETESDKEGIIRLEEAIATLLWEIWESYPAVKRCDVTDDYWIEVWKARVSAYPLLDEEYERSCARERK